MSGKTVLIGILVALAAAVGFKFLVDRSPGLFGLGGGGGASGATVEPGTPTLTPQTGYNSR
jgi:hypothetical protein